MGTILVTGGAGYIGSFMTRRLLDEGYTVVVADFLKRGHQQFVDNRAKLKIGDCANTEFVSSIFSEFTFDAVIHFAGYISMSESMQQPGLYFNNNIMPALTILEEMKKNNVSRFIFSSTAGVYGDPLKLPMNEEHPKQPTNPYGQSKLMVEEVLPWYQKIHNIRFVSLRYFNAAGASLDGQYGEYHNPESHLIPNAIKAALTGSKFVLYGNDYDTKDGTCVRDYIHVLDLVEAHVLALKKIEKESGGYFYNIGTGKGYSNLDVLKMIETVSEKNIQVTKGPRRFGDAHTLIADATVLVRDLNFQPKYSDLKTIVATAWHWHKQYIK